MADISALVFQKSEIKDGIVIGTVFMIQESADLRSALTAYPEESINLGGTIPGGAIYPDATVFMEEDFTASKEFDANSFGESLADSQADEWVSYVASQITEGITLLDSKAIAFDDEFSTVSSLVDPV